MFTEECFKEKEMKKVALFYIKKYIWFNGIQVDSYICFWSIVTCSLLKTSLYTHKKIRLRKAHSSLVSWKQCDLVDILKKFHPQTALLRTTDTDKGMGIRHKMLCFEYHSDQVEVGPGMWG